MIKHYVSGAYPEFEANTQNFMKAFDIHDVTLTF